jgi:hypothetical protein
MVLTVAFFAATFLRLVATKTFSRILPVRA